MNCSVGCSVLNLCELDLAVKHQCRSCFSSSPSTVSGLQLWHSGSNRTDPEVPGGAWEEGRASASEPAPPPDRFVHSGRLLPTVAHMGRNLRNDHWTAPRSLMHSLHLHYVSSTFNLSLFRNRGGGGDTLLRWPNTFHYWPGLLLSGVCATRGGPLSSI